MNPAQLLEHFDRINEAPDAVARLRRFILDLAVRGKLVEQNSNDEPASELFKRIQTVTASDVAGTRKQAVITKVGDSDVPFPAPLGWLWLRFGLVHDLVRGVTYTKSDVAETQVADYLPILRANNIGDSLNFDDLVFVRQECIGPDQMLRRGDYLIALSSGSKNLVGKAAFVDADHPCGFGGFCGVIRLISPLLEQFVGVFLSSRLYRDAISAGSRGIGINNLKRETLNEALFPLPPLAEQHRIVAKVDELMALCDQLEAAKNEREARRDRLVAASLHRIGTAPAAADEAATADQSATPLHDAARFHLDHLPHLTTRPEHIKQLRQTILNLAVRGCLVPQDPNDEPAAEVLKCVVEERAALIKEGRIRKGKPLTPIANESVPFEVPRSWVWAKIGEAALFTEYGTSQQSNHSDSGVPVLKMGDIQEGRLLLGGQKKVPATIDDLPALYLENRDLLYNRTNSAELVGKTGIYMGSDNEYTFASYLIRIRCSQLSTNPEYFNMAMNAPWFRETQIVPQLKQQCGQANVNGTIMKNMLIPIPPLAEQHRIVAKVDELMALCDQLEAQLTTTQTDSRRLLEAVLHEALAAAA